MRSSAISSRGRGTAIRRSGPSAGRRARPTSGAPRPRRISTGPRRDAERGDSQIWRVTLGPHRGRLDRHAARAPHQIEFEIDKLTRPVRIRDRAHAEQAIAQPSLQRPEHLPLEPIERISGRMALRDRSAGELLAPIIVVALRARKIELALALGEHRAAGFEKRSDARVVRDVDRHAARLLPDIGCESEQLLALEGKRRRALLFGAAGIDPLLEIDGTAARRVAGGVGRRPPLHARARAAVAVRACFAGRPLLAPPDRLAVEHPKGRGIDSVIVLHRARLARHEVVARLALGEWNVGRSRRGAQRREHENSSGGSRHSTVILTDSDAVKPLSPVHSKLSVPLSLATVKNVRKGLAAIAGKSSARKISSPLYLQMNSLMMSRGTGLPVPSGRKPVSMTCEISVLISITSPRLAFGGALMRARAMLSSPRGTRRA